MKTRFFFSTYLWVFLWVQAFWLSPWLTYCLNISAFLWSLFCFVFKFCPHPTPQSAGNGQATSHFRKEAVICHMFPCPVNVFLYESALRQSWSTVVLRHPYGQAVEGKLHRILCRISNDRRLWGLSNLEFLGCSLEILAELKILSLLVWSSWMLFSLWE